MKIKVLHVYRTYFPDPVGGVQEVMRQISLSTKPHNIEVKIFVLSPNPVPRKINFEGVEVVRARSWMAPASCDLGGFDAYKIFKNLLDWCDVVNYGFPWPFADILHLVARSKKPSVISYHSDIIRQNVLGALYKPLMKKTLSSVDAVVASSENYVGTSKVLKKYVAKAQLKIIPNGIIDYANKFVGQDFEVMTLKKFKLENRSFVLAVGALRYYKGLHTLVEAGLRINATVLIAGCGPEEKALEKLASKLGITNIIFAGLISDNEKIVLLRYCSVFALPSHLRSEAYGMVLVEASMFGKPMVCCDIQSGPSFINLNGETGIVVPPEDPEAFSRAVNLLLDTDIGEQYGKAARKRYEEYFSGEAFGLAYAQLYQSLLNE